MCLQEVEEESELHAFMRSEGYDGSKSRKPDPSRKDGPSTYYDKRRFAHVNTYLVPFNYKPESKTTHKEMYMKGNVCLITVLERKSNKNHLFIIANTHLNFNTGRGDIKLAEIKVLTDTLAEIK